MIILQLSPRTREEIRTGKPSVWLSIFTVTNCKSPCVRTRGLLPLCVSYCAINAICAAGSWTDKFCHLLPAYKPSDWMPKIISHGSSILPNWSRLTSHSNWVISLKIETIVVCVCVFIILEQSTCTHANIVCCVHICFQSKTCRLDRFPTRRTEFVRSLTNKIVAGRSLTW